jgi:chromosome segregation ATPase
VSSEYPSRVAAERDAESLRERCSAIGEEAIGRIAQDLLENPWVNSMLSAALEARGRAAAAQEMAMEFLNVPSAAQIERLTRRVRSISQRLESIEDALQRLEDGLRSGTPQRLDAIERQLADTKRLLGTIAAAQPQAPTPVSPGQERLRVEEQAS